MPYRGPRLREVFALDTGDTPREIQREWGRRALEEVRERTPIGRPDPFEAGHVGGKLRASWRVRTYQRGGVWVSSVSTGVDYAEFVERGTSPHTIHARNARALRFMAGGATVFARSVRHPGTEGHFMLARGIEATRIEFYLTSKGPLRSMIRRWRIHVRAAGKKRR